MTTQHLEIGVKPVGQHKWMSLHVGYYDEPYVSLGTGIFVVPITARGEVLFVVEPAIPDNKPILSLPSGAIDAPETPAEAAHRELQEEIGFRAGRMDFLSDLNPLAKHAVGCNHIFLARDLTPARRQGDEAWSIKVEPIPFENFEAQIASGRLTYATVIAALFLARRFIQSER